MLDILLVIIITVLAAGYVGYVFFNVFKKTRAGTCSCSSGVCPYARDKDKICPSMELCNITVKEAGKGNHSNSVEIEEKGSCFTE
ncbi:MAG: FeoB-associated Cys-rich membrane protein [Planctomycetia bacterium]|nr:FeoB-associated Cys-rich membrane protein [Planctomycetia bacterium]